MRFGRKNRTVRLVLGRDFSHRSRFMRNMHGSACCTTWTQSRVHGFPLDWNHWKIDEWPNKIADIQAVTDLPVWVSEVGVSTFGAEQVSSSD